MVLELVYELLCPYPAIPFPTFSIPKLRFFPLPRTLPPQKPEPTDPLSNLEWKRWGTGWPDSRRLGVSDSPPSGSCPSRVGPGQKTIPDKPGMHCCVTFDPTTPSAISLCYTVVHTCMKSGFGGRCMLSFSCENDSMHSHGSTPYRRDPYTIA